MNIQGLQGAVFQMISHGLVSGALFLCVGVLYDRMHTKKISFYQGVGNNMPNFAFLFMIFALASLGLPATSGFIGEFMVLLAVFKVNHAYGVMMAFGMVLGAAYILWLFVRIIFGKLNENVKNISDISFLERLNLTIIAVFVIFLGIYPNIVNQYTKSGMINIEQRVKKFEQNNKVEIIELEEKYEEYQFNGSND